MNKICLFITSLSILTILSCSVEYLLIAPYNNGIMTEYQYRDGYRQLVITFQRSGRTKYLRSVNLKCNTSFALKGDYDGKKENDCFIIDIDKAKIYLGNTPIALTVKKDSSFGTYIYVGDKDAYILLNHFESTNHERLFHIIPSDFITVKGKRVINDTINLNIYED